MSAQIQAIKDQTLGIIAEVLTSRKPSYKVADQEYKWTEYLAQLQKTVEWCNDQLLLDDGPAEFQSQGFT